MKLKLVRATRNGSWDGHRRRKGAEFVVRADAKESWFEDIGPAPEGAELPSQLQTAQARQGGKSFIDVMRELGTATPPSTALGDQKQATLTEAAPTALKGEAPPADSESIV